MMVSMSSRLFGLSAIALSLSGCGHRYISPRSTNPLIEDRVRMGPTKADKMSVLTSRADRRTVLVFGPNKVCAEPSPDVAEAVYSQSSVELAKAGVRIGAGSTLRTALMQLTRRSQGLDYYRSGSFINCMLYYNGVFSDKTEYIRAMEDLLVKSVAMTEKEIKNLPEVMKAVVHVSDDGDDVDAEVEDPPAGKKKEEKGKEAVQEGEKAK